MKKTASRAETNSRQVGIVVFLLSIIFKVSTLPSLLYTAAGRTSYIIIAFILIIDFAHLALVLLVVKFGGFDGLKEAYGKNVPRLIALLLLFPFVLKSIIFLDEAVKIVSGFLFYNATPLPIVIAIMLAVFYISTKGFGAIFRVFEIAIWAIPMIIILGLCFGKMHLNTNFLSPLFDGGGQQTANAISKHLLYTLDFSPLLFIKFAKKKGPWIVTGASLALVFIVGFYMVFVANYGDFATLNNSAFMTMASFNIVISEIGSLDWPAALFWIGIGILNLSMKHAAGIEILKPFNIKRTYAAGAMAVTIAALYLLAFKNSEEIKTFASGGIQYAVFGVEILVCIIALILLVIKNKNKSAPSKDPNDEEATNALQQKSEVQVEPQN